MSTRTAVALVFAIAALGYCVKGSFDEKVARAECNAVVAALQKHMEQTGKYPTDLSQIGFDQNKLRNKWYLSYRLEQDGTPALFYSAQDMWLAAWHYDFAAKKWYSVN